jgi:hypothetical protein
MLYSLVINIVPIISGGNSFHFFPKIFPENFHEYVTCGIEPPFGVSKCHIWGGYGGGEGVLSDIAPHARIEGSPYGVNNFI